MSTKDIATMLTSIGVPFAYHHFDDSESDITSPPFIIFYYPYSSDLYADDVNYASIRQLNIELYTDEKDPELEEKVEQALLTAGLPWRWDETYITDEHMFMKAYYTQVCITEEEATNGKEQS